MFASERTLTIYNTGLIFFLMLVMWKDGELPVLPLSVYGAVAMAHNEVSDEYSSPYQFFFYLYDKRSVSTLHQCPHCIPCIFSYLYALLRLLIHKITVKNGSRIFILFLSCRLAWEGYHLMKGNFQFLGKPCWYSYNLANDRFWCLISLSFFFSDI